MILPINDHPSLTSYVQHSYPNTIIESRDLLTLFVNKMDKYIWMSDSFDIESKIMNEFLYLKEKNDNRDDTDFSIWRDCLSEDEIIVKTEYIKLTDNMTYIELYLSEENNINKKLYSIRWNQYNVNVNDITYSIDTLKYIYFKLVRKGIILCSYVSMDGVNWELIDSIEIGEVCKCIKCNLYIHVYFGPNQYLAWKYLNYLQLFYCDTDPNGLCLDYYMFPRKGSDASYQCLCHFLDTVYEKLEECIEIYKSIHNYIKYNINHSFYVNICLDEFHISDRSAFQREHFNHYNLLYGYDDIKSVYNIIGYNAGGKIVSTEVPYDKLIIVGNDIVKYRYNTNPNRIVFNINFLISSVKEFIAGTNSSEKTMNLLTQQNGKYGFSIFDELLSTNKGNNILINDRRVSFVLYEHCKIMQDRLGFLFVNNFIPFINRQELVMLCENMQNSSGILKNLVIKYSINKNNESNVINQLKVLNNHVSLFYSRLLEVLLECNVTDLTS